MKASGTRETTMSCFSVTICALAFLAIYSPIHAEPTTIHDDECFDKTDCAGFNRETTCCGQYEAYSKANCRRHCNFCFPTVTAKPNCVDAIPNCDEYNADLCSNKLYDGFVKENCAGHCKLCNKPVYHPPCAGNGTHGMLTKPPTTMQTTTPTLPKNSCSSEGLYYKTGDRWYTGDCKQQCNCVDGVMKIINCQPTKCPKWVHNCDLVYKEGACCPTLKCNYFNTVHGPRRTLGRK